MNWFERCRKRALLKQKAMYSWARTLALSAVLCLIGVLLEAEFDQPITLHTILTGFRRMPATTEVHVPDAPGPIGNPAPAGVICVNDQ